VCYIKKNVIFKALTVVFGYYSWDNVSCSI